MIKQTRLIRNKGYTLNEFCDVIGYSLRWYREHVGKASKQGKLIDDYIEQMSNRY